MGHVSFKSRRAAQRRRRRTLASLAGISLALLIASWSAIVSSAASAPLPTLPPLPSLPLPSITPTPLPPPPATPAPCPSSLPLPILPTPAGCPAVVPPTNPGATPAPGSSPVPPSGPGGPGGPAGTGPGSPAQRPGAFGYGGMPAHASVQPSGLLQLLGLLGTPPNVGVETPTLQHFGNVPSQGTTSSTGSSGPSTAPPSALAATRPHLPAALWLAMLLSLLVAVGLGLLSRRIRRPRIARGAAIATVPFLLVIVGGAIAASPPSAPALMSHRFARLAPAAAHAVQAAPAAQVAQVPVRSLVTASSASTQGAQLLAQLTTYESQVARDETQIEALTVPAGNQRGPFDSTTDPATTARQVAASLEATLQQEYSFFLSTAQDPAQVEGLIEATTGGPVAVRQAVTYDVQAVEAQMAQEAAIAQAAQGSSGGTASAPSSLTAPLNGAITQPFGASSLVFEPALTFNGVTYPHFHTGIDIAGPLDAPIQAAAPGVVALAGAETDNQGRLVGYGNYVVIAHGGQMVTLYGHLDRLLVHVGQAVHAGDVIGQEGSSGNSTGPHLHFEVRIAGLLSDPARYLGAQLKAL